MNDEDGTYIRVTVEIVPRGDLRIRRELGRATISNIGGNQFIGDFDIVIKTGAIYGRGNKVWKSGRVLDVPRSKLGPWDILYRLLAVTIGNRNPSVGKDGTGAARSARHNAKRKTKNDQE